MGVAWLQRDTALPQQRMIIVCHLHRQAAWIGYHPLQGKWWILVRRARSHSVSLLSEQSSIWGECWKIGLSLPTSTPLLLVNADSSMHSAPLVLVCHANQSRAQKRRDKFILDCWILSVEFIVISGTKEKYMGNGVRAEPIIIVQTNHQVAMYKVNGVFNRFNMWKSNYYSWGLLWNLWNYCIYCVCGTEETFIMSEEITHKITACSLQIWKAWVTDTASRVWNIWM